MFETFEQSNNNIISLSANPSLEGVADAEGIHRVYCAFLGHRAVKDRILTEEQIEKLQGRVAEITGVPVEELPSFEEGMARAAERLAG